MAVISAAGVRNYHKQLTSKIEEAMREHWRDDYKGKEIVEIMTVIEILASVVGILGNDYHHAIKAIEIDEDRIQAALDIESGNNHYIKVMEVADKNFRKLYTLIKKHKICSFCGCREKHKKGCWDSHVKL